MSVFFLPFQGHSLMFLRCQGSVRELPRSLPHGFSLHQVRSCRGPLQLRLRSFLGTLALTPLVFIGLRLQQLSYRLQLCLRTVGSCLPCKAPTLETSKAYRQFLCAIALGNQVHLGLGALLDPFCVGALQLGQF
jgi:hypothetical protein